jgi:hypothetical protein
VFGIDEASENIFEGDSGDTQPMTLPTRRIGIEWTNDYRPVWLDLEADVADTRARWLPGGANRQRARKLCAWRCDDRRHDQPHARRENRMVWMAHLSLFRAPAADGRRRLHLSCDWPPQCPHRYKFDNGWTIQLDGFNITNSRSDQITYAYGSLLKTDALCAQCIGPVANRPPVAVCQNGVMDRVFKPVEPLQLRLTLVGKF